MESATRPYREARRLITETADHDRQYGELPDWTEEPWPAGLDPYELQEALKEADRWLRSARHIQSRIRETMRTDVVEHGAIRLGDTLYRDVPDSQRVLTDRDGLVEWLAGDLEAAVRVSMSNVRITAVRGIAAARGLDPQTVEDTFFGWKDNEPGRRKLSETPITRAPKWAQTLTEGDRR